MSPPGVQFKRVAIGQRIGTTTQIQPPCNQFTLCVLEFLGHSLLWPYLHKHQSEWCIMCTAETELAMRILCVCLWRPRTVALRAVPLQVECWDVPIM